MNEINETPEQKPEKSPLPLWRRILLGLILLAIAVLCLIIPASYMMGRQLGAEVVKISEAGEPLKFVDLRKVDLNQANATEDAARYYVEALMNVNPEGLQDLQKVNTFYREKMLTLPASEFPDELHERTAQNLAGYQSMFEKFDQAADLPLSRFDIGIQQGIKMSQTRVSRVNVATLMLSMRTLDLILRGDDDAAANSIITALRILRIFDIHPTMFLNAAKTGLINLACEDIQLLLKKGQVSEELLLKLQQTLSEVIPKNVLERMFLAERVYQLEIGRNYIPKNISLRLLQADISNLPERISLTPSFLGRMRLRYKSTKFLQDIASLLTISRDPWPKPLAAFKGISDSEKQSKNLISGGIKFIQMNAGIIAIVRCTMISVLIERYHRSHGELPGSLDNLIPTYVDSIPTDPFTGNKPLYIKEESGYVIYCAGINGQDDNGSIIPKTSEERPLDTGFRINLRESK